MVPARLAEKMSVMSVGTSPFSAHRTIAAERVHIAFTGPVRAASGAWRRPERPQGLPRAGRTARARGRGRFGAPPAHAAPGEGSPRGAGSPTRCVPLIRPFGWCGVAPSKRRARVSPVFFSHAAPKKGSGFAPPAMSLEPVDTTAPKIANSLAREQKARRSRFIATRASRSAARASQLDMLRRKSSFCEKAKPAPEWAIR